jgi:hypothetical protein
MSSVADRLAALYDRVPQVGCRGLCADSCTAIDGVSAERDVLEAAGFALPAVRATPGQIRLQILSTGAAPRCPALSEAGRCQVYERRPFICRLFGTTPGLTCEHGCLPDRWVTRTEVREMFEELHAIEAQDHSERRAARR